MKKSIKLLSIIFLFCGSVFTSCTSEVDPPTNLSVSSISQTSARLNWTGTADSYEITVGNKTYTSTTNYYNLTGLTENTPYSWKVRAKVGDVCSEWANGENFKTLSSGTNPPPTPSGTTFVRFKRMRGYAGLIELALKNSAGEIVTNYVFSDDVNTSVFKDIPAGIYTPMYFREHEVLLPEQQGWFNCLLTTPPTYNFKKEFRYTIEAYDLDDGGDIYYRIDAEEL